MFQIIKHTRFGSEYEDLLSIEDKLFLNIKFIYYFKARNKNIFLIKMNKEAVLAIFMSLLGK